MRVAGIDTSLTGTGLALVGDVTVSVHTFGSKGHTKDTLYERYLRLRHLVTDVTAAVKAFDPDLVVIEAPSYGAVGGATHDRAGLWWLIVAILSAKVPVLEVPSPTRCKYATGKGNATKDDVLLAVARRHPDILIQNNNEADALVLALIGLRLAEHPVEETLPKEHLDALKNLVLPEGLHADEDQT